MAVAGVGGVRGGSQKQSSHGDDVCVKHWVHQGMELDIIRYSMLGHAKLGYAKSHLQWVGDSSVVGSIPPPTGLHTHVQYKTRTVLLTHIIYAHIKA